MAKRLIFLDFDGVLRPMASYQKIRTKERNLKEVLSERYHDPAYLKIDETILQNVYYHFHGEACYCVRMLAQLPDTEIILSTSWRSFYPLDVMQKLLELHKIGRYVTGCTPEHYQNRPVEIQKVLDQRTDVDHYLIIDDLDLEQHFPGHMLLCKDHLKLSQYRQGYEILTT